MVPTISMMTLYLASMSLAATAQDARNDDTQEPWNFALQICAPSLDSDEIMLPRSLSDVLLAGEETASFSIGPVGGYLRARGADRGTWFGGVQARLHFLRFLAAEASITFHENRYEHGDVVVTQSPVQLTAFLYIVPEGPVRPYIMGGVGWYYTRIDYRDSLAASFDDKTENMFGEHLGAGVEMMLSPRVSIDVDFRYIFLNPTSNQVLHGDFSYGQVTAGLNLFF